MTLTPAQRRLLALAREAEDGHLRDARAAVLWHFQQVNLQNAEKALKAALSQPAAQRRESLKGVLQLIAEATRSTRTPPREVLAVMRRAVRGRVLNTADLALLSDSALVFGDTRELEARAVDRQRQEMNGYWGKESRRFRNQAAQTIREGIRRGLNADEVAGLLQGRLDVSRGRAVLIAQDSMLTAASRAEIAVLKAAGADRFMWHTVGDARVRKSHAILNGRVFTWRAAPELPGSAIRCRCRAIYPPAR